MTIISLNALETWLWDSADILRGSIDSSDFKNYIFGLLFLKRANDVFEEEVESIMKADQDIIINENKEGKDKGFETEDQIVVFNSMKTIFNDGADDATRRIFECIDGEMSIVGWEEKGMVRKEMENKIIKVLLQKMERVDARQKAKELVELIARNNHA
jgi:type I restriction enzyme, R subunit